MDYNKVSSFEHRFWLQVLGDHARFIYHTLSPSEVEHIQQAHYFLQMSDHLLEQSRKMTQASKEKWMELAQHAYTLADGFRNYKLHLINLHLDCKITIGLPPTFINHMVNEVEEYIRVLVSLVRGEVPPLVHPVHHHTVWLLDAAGHAAAVHGELDPVEFKEAEKAQAFEESFNHFFIKAKEMAGFMRARQDLFPSLQKFNQETSLEIKLFYHFLEELKEMRLDCRKLGTLMPLMADHMAREECYYIIKLEELDPNNVEGIECDPTRPRVEG